MDLTVTFLGTSSAAPTKDRGLPSIAIIREGEAIILDCGEGVQRQVLAEQIGLNRETTILISHLHGDHVTGLLGLLQTMSLAQRSKPLRIVAPKTLWNWLKVTYKVLHIGLTFSIEFYPARKGTILRLRNFTIKGTSAVHSIEAYSYLVEEKGRPGIFYPERARSLGIPEGRLWSKLQGGRRVVFEGKKIGPREVTGPPRPGRRIGYSGDTRPSDRLVRFFAGCDLLIFDSTFSNEDEKRAQERKHSTSVEAAETAKKAKVKKLALTHFSARYPNSDLLLRQARRVFPNTFAAKDGLKIKIDYPPS